MLIYLHISIEKNIGLLFSFFTFWLLSLLAPSAHGLAWHSFDGGHWWFLLSSWFANHSQCAGLQRANLPIVSLTSGCLFSSLLCDRPARTWACSLSRSRSFASLSSNFPWRNDRYPVAFSIARRSEYRFYPSETPICSRFASSTGLSAFSDSNLPCWRAEFCANYPLFPAFDRTQQWHCQSHLALHLPVCSSDRPVAWISSWPSESTFTASFACSHGHLRRKY